MIELTPEQRERAERRLHEAGFGATNIITVILDAINNETSNTLIVPISNMFFRRDILRKNVVKRNDVALETLGIIREGASQRLWKTGRYASKEWIDAAVDAVLGEPNA